MGKKETKRRIDALRDAPLEEKYRHAVLVLQAISQATGSYKDGRTDEWSQAWAFIGCNIAAEKALVYLGEPTIMPNKAGKK